MPTPKAYFPENIHNFQIQIQDQERLNKNPLPAFQYSNSGNSYLIFVQYQSFPAKSW
ncbi:MAG: hypothetical protein Ta2E_10660 [Mycoplasmoidaceae bacterium]|nr:MAG: hypothetical protein Ta2E_10660 [Mycoplasmoidaceae bacterium]